MAKMKVRLTYIPPKERFIMVSKDIINKFEPFVVGIFCKIIRLSSGKSLDIEFISKNINVSPKKLRKAIVLLEDKGYITREPTKTDDGKFSGWNYQLHAEPVADKLKTHAGKAKEDENGLDQKWTSPQTDKSKNGSTIISNNDIIYNNTDNNSNINIPVNKEDIECVPEGTAHAPSDEETKYIEGMRKQFPRIMRMEQPLTLEQAKKLKEKFDGDLLRKVMHDMENWKPLIKKNVSAYQTIRKWCEMEINRV